MLQFHKGNISGINVFQLNMKQSIGFLLGNEDKQERDLSKDAIPTTLKNGNT